MLIKCKCISERNGVPEQITIGAEYLLDSDYLYSTNDGDWYARIYDTDMRVVGTLNIRHFIAIP